MKKLRHPELVEALVLTEVVTRPYVATSVRSLATFSETLGLAHCEVRVKLAQYL